MAGDMLVRQLGMGSDAQTTAGSPPTLRKQLTLVSDTASEESDLTYDCIVY